MTYPLCNRQDLEELLVDEEARITALMFATPVSLEAAHRRTEGLVEARARKAALLADLDVLEAREEVAS